MVIDFRGYVHKLKVASIKGQTAESVQTLKSYWLKTALCSKLWSHVQKGTAVFVLFEKTVPFPHWQNLDDLILLSFYWIDSVSLVSGIGNLSLKNRNSVNQIVQRSSRLIGESQLNAASQYNRRLQQRAGLTLNDDSHPLHSKFLLLPSGVCSQGTEQSDIEKSFVPTDITQELLTQLQTQMP